MFCKNCGREIDRRTLEKLMRPSGESATCPNCGEEVDTAEFCGGFWGLVASGEALQGGSGEKWETETGPAEPAALRKNKNADIPGGKPDRAGQNYEGSSRRGARIPGVTETDRVLARMILEEESSRDAAGTERSGGRAAGAGSLSADPDVGAASDGYDKKAGDSGKKADNSARNTDGSGKKADSSGKKAVGSGKKAGGSVKKADGSGKKAGGSGRGKTRGGFQPAAAALLAAAVLVGFLAGRFLPFSSGGGRTGAGGTEQTAEGPDGEGTDAKTAGNLKGEDADAQAHTLAQSDDRNDRNADAQAGEDNLSAQDKEGASDTSNAEDGGQGGSSPENTSGPVATDGGGYNMIRRTLTEVNDLLIEDSVLYYGTQDSGITFDGEKLRNEWLSGAGGISYVKTDIGESDGTLTELDRIYYDKNGDEINNSSGYSRVKYEYDDQGALEKKKYYAMIDGRAKDMKICTSECRIRESGEESVSVEIFEPSEKAADNETFRYRKAERTFMPQDSDLPGALNTVRYYLDESDPEPEREEVHEYSRVDVPASEEKTVEYDYCVEETIRIFVRKSPGENHSARGALSAYSETTAESAQTAASGITSETAGFGETAESAEMAASDSTSEAADSEISAKADGSVMTDLITIRYYFEEDDDQLRLVRMGFYQDGSPAEGKAGFSGFTRSYSAGKTVWEDIFFGTEERTENEDSDPGAVPGSGDAKSATDPGSRDTKSATGPGSGDSDSATGSAGSGDPELASLLGSEDPLLAGEAVPGYYSAENPWLFLIP